MNKQQLASKIWDSANKMRSKIEANEYKDYILGFIFYKFLSDKEVKFLKENDFSDKDIENINEEDGETLRFIQNGIGYFIAYKDLFSTWISIGKDFNVSNVRDALSAFSRLINSTHKKVFDSVFDTLQTGLSKLGDSSGSQTKAISDLIQLINGIPMNGRQDYDVLGFIYEYLIGMFAANAGKKAGEFYTPHEVSLLMSEIVANHLKEKDEIKIYDPTSGSGSLLINIGRAATKYIKDENNIKYYAQELKENTYNLTRMNLVMRGILPDNIVTRNGDTLEEDWPFFDENDPIKTYNPLYVDAVVSNPPYSQPWDSTNKEADPRYARFGVAPKSKADYAFLLHDLFHIKSDGIMTIVLPHGVLFRGGEEGEIRKNLIEQNHIDTIIGLPANIFFGTGIPTIIMVLKQKRENTDVLIVDASKGFIKEGKNNKLRASDIKKAVDTVIKRESIEKFSRIVEREEIRNNDYNLNIPRYVDSSDEAESYDIYATMFGGIPENEIDKLNKYWITFPNLRKSLFLNENVAYSKLIVDDVKKTITNHQDVLKYVEKFNSVFNDVGLYLASEIVEKMMTINIHKEESVLSNNIFSRLENIDLIDKYEAYQLLDNEWTKVAIDLEIIQTEGFEATKKVDPNIVLKKKNGKDEEVQEGWIGHIIPFGIVQNRMLKDELEELKINENRLSEILSEYEEILDSFTEDEKQENSNLLNEDNSAFMPKEIAKKAKEINSNKLLKSEMDEESTEYKVIKLNSIIEEEKELKKEVKSKTLELYSKTKTTIENLSDEQAIELLKDKWIAPLVENISQLPNNVINELVSKMQIISSKYETTYLDVEKQINESEKILSSLIDELEGNEFDMKGLSEFQSLLKGE